MSRKSIGSDIVASIIVPCYNYGKFVGEAISSILEQDFHSFELIVVDDGSNDDSVQVIESVLGKYKGKSKAIDAFLIKQTNRGVSSAINAGLKVSRGQYILTHDADDIMCRGRIERQIQFLRKNPQVGCVGGKTERIDVNGKLESANKKNRNDAVQYYDFDYVLTNAFVVGGGVAAFPKMALMDAGGYDENIGIQDFQITLKVAFSGRYIAMLPDVVVLYRNHENSLSKKVRFEHCEDLKAIEPYHEYDGYGAARRNLIVKALKYSSIDDKSFALRLFFKIPLRLWNRKVLRRLRHFIFKWN